MALDRAREKSQGANAIGTTGRGIGPAYEDKVARRALRVADLFHRERFAAKLGEILDYHNFILQRYFQAAPIDFQQVLESNLELGERVKPLVADVTGILERLSADGAQRAVRGRAGRDARRRSRHLSVRHLLDHHAPAERPPARGWVRGGCDEVLGIVKAYTTRVGAGPFPTELFDECGEHLSRVGHEFGSVTGRQRRCGWFDAVALRRSIVHSSCSALCVTKLDVLDGLDTIRVCVGYKIDGAVTFTPPLLSEQFGDCEAVYEDHARLEGQQRRRDPIRGPAGQCPQLPRAAAGAGRRAHQHHLHRSGSRSDHLSPASLRVR